MPDASRPSLVPHLRLTSHAWATEQFNLVVKYLWCIANLIKSWSFIHHLTKQIALLIEIPSKRFRLYRSRKPSLQSRKGSTNRAEKIIPITYNNKHIHSMYCHLPNIFQNNLIWEWLGKVHILFISNKVGYFRVEVIFSQLIMVAQLLSLFDNSACLTS